ncbi:MAG: patatin-like phospholipase family protein [Clostridia bacterium]|nr:patatin-like phospholipase family protein [Clostridia bacterium]
MAEILGKIFKGRKKGKKLGLGLGGGGAKGSVHVGALKAFEEEGITFDTVAGTSIGSIVGGLYARGLSAREIEAVVLGGGLNDVKNILLSRLSGGGVDGLIGIATGKMDFSDLKIPFAAIAVDLENGEEAVFTEGDLVKCMGASSAIPPYFRAVEYGGRTYVDGAFRNIIPCDAARNLGADFVIGIDLSGGRQTNFNGKKTLDEMYPDNGVPVCNPSEAGYAACDIMITPDLSGYSATSIGAIAEMYEIGYFAAKGKMPEIKAALKEKKIRVFK